VPEPLNAQVAARLEEVSRILEQQGANRYRVRAYRRAATTLRRLDRGVDEMLRQGGLQALQELPGVGPSLARSIHVLVTAGRLPMLERLRGEGDPEALLATVPGIGRRTAERLHRDLGLETLEDLEAAAGDGRLSTVAGIGEKRLAGIRDSLAHRLGRVRRPAPPAPEPASVDELLGVDEEYRDKAAAGLLPRIAPRRFNPGGEAWLPVLHTVRGERHYTALYSNTGRAHAQGATRDWVVLYHDSGDAEGQATVITARRGPLRGLRIVPGREAECAEHYARAEPHALAS
jgi:Holliday junction resolvasome RuvABC DNA-binding subunit